MPLVGGGNYRRSVTHVENLVQAVRLAIVTPQASGQTYYVVDDEISTTRAIVDAMADALGVPARFIRLPALIGSVAYGADRLLEAAGLYSGPVHLLGESNWHVAISSAKAKRELGYAPARSLREGMREAVAWCREHGKL
jgi:nucleoside-diphosphate-sugar epimerase